MQGLIAGMRETTPEVARKQIMIGDKAECLETVERYRQAGVTHFIFMTFAPHNVDEIRRSPRRWRRRCDERGDSVRAGDSDPSPVAG